MSPEPSITTRFPTIFPARLTYFCAAPAVETPLGRSPGVPIAPRVLSAPCRKDDATRFDALKADGRGRDGDFQGRVLLLLVALHLKRGRFERHDDVALRKFVDETPRIFGPGQLRGKALEAKSVMNTLVENAPHLRFAFYDENAFSAAIISGDRGGQARRAASQDDDVPRLGVDVGSGEFQ